MQMIIAGLAAYLGEDPESIPAHSGRNLYHGNLPLVDKAIIRTLAAFQVCAGLAASHRNGVPFTPVYANGSFLSNLLTMIGKVDKKTGKPDPKALRAIQRTWALGADLGHTNSTFAFLLEPLLSQIPSRASFRLYLRAMVFSALVRLRLPLSHSLRLVARMRYLK